MRRTKLAVFLLTAFFVVKYTSPAHGTNSCANTPFALDDDCEFFAKRSVAKVYAEPDLKSKVVTELRWLYTIRVRKEDFEKMPKGWVRHSTDEPGFTHRYTGWVRTDTLVDSKELKQVTACWGIKRVSYSAGDFSIDVFSKPDGRYYDARDTKMIKLLGRIYFAQDVVFYVLPLTPALRAEMKDVRMSQEELAEVTDQFIAGYDPTTRELFPYGYKPDDLKVEYHSPEALKGCKGIVTKQRKKNK